jgi:hypothetical protein
MAAGRASRCRRSLCRVRVLGAALVLVAVVVLPACARDPEPDGVITGTLLAPDGTPLAGTLVAAGVDPAGMDVDPDDGRLGLSDIRCELVECDNDQRAVARTADDGSFQLTFGDLAAGAVVPWYVTAVRDGEERLFVSWNAAPRVFDLGPLQGWDPALRITATGAQLAVVTAPPPEAGATTRIVVDGTPMDPGATLDATGRGDHPMRIEVESSALGVAPWDASGGPSVLRQHGLAVHVLAAGTVPVDPATNLELTPTREPIVPIAEEAAGRRSRYAVPAFLLIVGMAAALGVVTAGRGRRGGRSPA